MKKAWDDWFKKFFEYFKTKAPNLSREQFAQECDRLFQRPPPEELTKNDNSTNKVINLTIYEARILRLANKLNMTFTKPQLSEIATATISEWRKEVSLDPNAHHCLDQLKLSKKIVLITDFDHPPNIYKILEEENLLSKFDAVIISGEVGVKKPDPLIFQIGLDKVNLDAKNVVYVGDSEECDIFGAHRVGMKPIFIQRNSLNNTKNIIDFNISTNRDGINQNIVPQLSKRCIQECSPIIITDLTQIIKIVE